MSKAAERKEERLENRPKVKTRYICPKCKEKGIENICKIDYFCPGMITVLLTCNHFVKKADLQEYKK